MRDRNMEIYLPDRRKVQIDILERISIPRGADLSERRQGKCVSGHFIHLCECAFYTFVIS